MTIVVDGKVMFDREQLGDYTLDEQADGDVMLVAKFAPILTGSVPDLPTGTRIDGLITEVELQL